MPYHTTAIIAFPAYRLPELPKREWTELTRDCKVQLDHQQGLLRITDPGVDEQGPHLCRLLEEARIDYDVVVHGNEAIDPFTDFVRFDTCGGREHKRVAESYSRRMLAIVLEHLEHPDGIDKARWLLQQMLSDRQPLKPSLADIAARHAADIPF